MSWRRWLRGDAASHERTRGLPPSPNGAASFHLWWRLPTGEALAEVAATLEVVVAPSVPRLYFWALQASFADGGAAHTGLQWQPTRRAVNWGGYDASGRILSGSASALPSAVDDPNTRDFPWEPGRGYRFRISRAPGGWRSEVTDAATGEATAIRDLHAGGATLASPVVWSEVFAACDDPPVTVRWSDLEARTAGGRRVAPGAVTVSYQSFDDGGCDNTTVAVDGGGGLLQTTSAPREVPAGTVLALR